MLKVFCLSNHKGHLHSTEAMTKVWNAFWFLHQKNSWYWWLVHVVLPLPWLPTNTISNKKFWSRQSRHHPWCRKERVVRALKPSAFASKCPSSACRILCYVYVTSAQGSDLILVLQVWVYFFYRTLQLEPFRYLWQIKQWIHPRSTICWLSSQRWTSPTWWRTTTQRTIWQSSLNRWTNNSRTELIFVKSLQLQFA